MSEFLSWSAVKIAHAIKNKSLSSEEITRACLDRIEEVNTKINAVVQIADERAIKEAQQCDKKLSSGESLGPLHGVPITLKDSIDTEGIISTGGTMGRKDFIPTVDAPVASRLRKAGAVLLGKTNTPELTLSGETNNLIYGRTSNPFDLDRSPGGSSGGSAAILAVGGSYLDLGSDTGGSIREPAHLNGITGIKPTSGRTPRTGHIVPYTGGIMDSLTQIGPMARYVEDLKLSLPIICGPDNIDPSVIPVPMGNPDDVDTKQLKIGFYTSNGVVNADENIVRVIGDVVNQLDGHNYQIEQVTFPNMSQLVSLSSQLREAGSAGMILRLLKKYNTTEPGPDLDGYFTDAGLKQVSSLDPELIEKIDLAKSQALQFMSGFDALICPPSKCIARPHKASHGDTFKDWSYITVLNLLGWPGASVRAGTSLEEGLPVGVQVIANPWREDIVLALLGDIESLMQGYQQPEI